MFKLHTPQSITLAVPGEDGPFTLINFRTNGTDTSRCVMEIISGDGDMHRLTFTSGGALVDQQFISRDHAENDPEVKPLTPADYIVDGRDTRADNPYTHVAPVDADTAYRDGQTPGHKQPPVQDKDGNAIDFKDIQEKAHQEAADAAKKSRGKTLDRLDEKPEDKAEREKKERHDRVEQGFEAEDRKADEGEQVATQRVFPETTGEVDPFGRGSTGEYRGNPDHDPFAPAPSAPLPGSPPAHPLDQPDPGAVNTSKSMGEPAYRP